MKKLYFIFLLLLLIVSYEVDASDYGYVIGDYVTIRVAPSTSSNKISRLIYGTKVDILEQDGDWYKINYDGVNTAFIASKYVKRKSEFTYTDANYCNILKEKGFPSSYCPYLSYLHKKYPTWSFTPLNTELDFYKDVVDGEEGKNYIQFSKSDGIRFLNAYSSSKSQKEVGGWYQANNTVNAYLLDPRNFLLEHSVFMFENLTYNSKYQNAKTVGSIFGSSSFLNDNTYIKYYLDAGKKYNISPNHLAARTRQEGASKETYGPVTGKSKATYAGNPLKGYYNFYNIGAYADSKTSSPQTRGLAYAAYLVSTGTPYGRPWNTREKAIKGGAEFMSKQYTSKGQNTLYFEKFQTNPNSSNSLYTHQYMTNVFAAYSEATMMSKAYVSSNLMSTAFNFIIPVYKNMPNETKQVVLLNDNNLLTSINIDGEPISKFDSDITDYTEYVDINKESVSITAISNSSDAVIDGVGDYTLSSDETMISIIVTAENSEQRIYNITIKKVADTTMPSDIVEKLSVKVDDNNLYGIHSDLKVQTFLSSAKEINENATIEIKNTDGELINSGIIKTGYTMTIQTIVSKPVTYTLSVNGDLTGDGLTSIQDLLKIQKHILKSSKLKGAYLNAADTNGDGTVNNIDLLRIQKHILGSINL